MKRKIVITLFVSSLLFGVTTRAQEISPEIASVSPNEWVKGEELVDRIKRYDSNANYIGILYDYDENNSKYKSDSYEKLGTILVEKAKKYFKVENVELINIKSIPPIKEKSNIKNYFWYNEYKWWNTKYKTILYLTFKPDKDIYVRTNENEDGYYSSRFTFRSSLKIYEFYLKNGKEKSKNYTLSIPIDFTIRSNSVKSFGRPTMSMKMKVKILDPEEVVRITDNKMESELSRWVSKKLDYSITPELIEPFYKESMLSIAENKPVKKESIAAKINRIKEDGNAIAVVLDIEDIKGSGSNIYYVENQVALPEKKQLQKIGHDIASRLNESFETANLFQFVMSSDLPNGYTWQDTKYKIVIEFTVGSKYYGGFKYLVNEGVYDVAFEFTLDAHAYAREYYIENGKQKHTLLLLSPVTFGSYKATSHFTISNSRNVTITDLERECDRSRDDYLVAELEKLINAGFPKLVGKLSK